ncbi:ATP-binding cassette domain-containing protein [Thalassobius vesicularis]|uniref:ATP-binding cassette domain-containing protein n=2 Tax=Thalassobius vesicularis TaxID=1294297 RepID=A0A4S3M7Q4_9RHOB|nr:ATP-binding cassette domain-containing protein [Thalassobius vesicularis]
MTAAVGTQPMPQARRRKVPTVLQFEAVECGAACLAMILARQGRFVPVELLRSLCGVTRDGAKASNILKAARSFGLEARGFRKEPGELGTLTMPVILHWNFEHFVVLEGIRGRRCWINDPATGRRVIGTDELDRAFTGVVLTFARTEAFRPGGKAAGAAAMLWRRLAAASGALTLIALLAVCLVATGLVLPAAIRVFVDGILVAGQSHWLPVVIGGLAVTALVRAGLILVEQSLLVRLNTRIAVSGAGRLVWHLLRLPIAFFMQRHAAEIADRINTNDETARLLSTEVSQTVLKLVEVLLYGLVLVVMAPVAGLAVWAMAIPNLLVLWLFSDRLRRTAETLRLRESRLVAHTAGIIQNIETIRASGREAAAFRKWAGLHAQVSNHLRRNAIEEAVFGALPVLLRGLSGAGVVALGGWSVLEGRFTLGDFLAFQTLSASFLAPLGAFLALGPDLANVRTGLMRAEDAMRYPVPPEPDTDSISGPAAGGLAVSGLSFGYSPLDPPLVEGIDLTVTPGASVALVGLSGSGKSTLGRLICGLLEPRGGDILLDGRALRSVPKLERANQIAYVDQEIFLFEGTVRDNLTLWLSSAPDADLLRALDDAALLDDILARPGGLSAPVAEGGANFSGGQRQRLEIARALVSDPAVIVLDEATAALDPEVEAQVVDRLSRRGITQVVIAHRLSTIRDAGEIIVLERGRIVERGTHDGLLARGGAYTALVGAT